MKANESGLAKKLEEKERTDTSSGPPYIEEKEKRDLKAIDPSDLEGNPLTWP